MKSPFPGMDPYIEACGLWGDFHVHLIERISEKLADDAPERYVVRCGERSYLVLAEEEGERRHAFMPDVGVAGPKRRTKPVRKNGGIAVAERVAGVEPVIMRAFIKEERREVFIEISAIDEATRELRLVTCIELLSPSNKRPGSKGWRLYQRKRESVMLGGVNLVEIDLLRTGKRMPMVDRWPKSPYTILVAPAFKEYACRVWPASFQHPVPPVLVPLAAPDADLSIDLQPMIEAIYARSRYERSIDYRKPLKPPLGPSETAWLQKQLRARKTSA